MQYAGFWRRAVAAVADLVLTAPFYYALQWGFGARSVLADVLFVGLFSVAYVWFFASRWQGSPGMFLMRVQIVDTRGARIGYGRAAWWVLTSVVGVAIAFAAVIWLQARYDLTRVEDIMQSVEAGERDVQGATAEIEAITGMPFIEFYGMALVAFVVTMGLSVVWMISVAVGRQKAGFHNWICGTRLVRKA